MTAERVPSRRRVFHRIRRAARVLVESMVPRMPTGLHLRERLLGLLLIAAGLGTWLLLYVFWTSGYQTPVQPPVPDPMPPSWSFAFNPLVWVMPLIALGASGLVFVGVRLLLEPYDG